MADNIIKLKVDSDEYQGKIKRASEGLQALGRSLRDAGKTFADADAKQVEFARELGKMQTVSNTAKGKIAEMSSAFVNLKITYLQMTDAEKQSPIGQAMSKSLEELKNRTIDAKRELEDLNKELNGVKTVETGSGGGGGGLFSGDKLSGMLQVMGGNLMTKGVTMAAGAVTSMVNEIGDAVKQGVELAKQGEGIRIAFERLGRGDILDGLREATHGTVTDIELMKAAVKFNDFKLPIEELGTMLAFAQQKAKDTGQSVDYMVDSIVTGLGRKSLMILDNLGLSAAEIKEKMAETGDMTKAVGAIIREQMSKAGDYVETAADRAAQATVSLQNKMEELGRKFAPVEEASNQLWTSMKIGILDIIGGPLATLLNQLTEAGRLKNQLNNMNGGGMMERFGNNLRNSKDPSTLYSRQLAAINRSINAAEAKLQQAEKGGMGSIQIYRERVQALKEVKKQYEDLYKTISSPAKNPLISSDADKKKIKKGGGKTGTVKTEDQLNNEEIQKLTQEYIKASDDRRKAIEGEIKTLQDRNKEIARLKDMALGKIGDDGSLSAMTQQLKELQSAQSESASGRDWDDYQKKIEDVTAKINVMKGVLSKDQQATFTVEVNAEQLEQLRMLLPAEDETIRINVEEGRVNLPEIPKEIEQVINTKVGDVVTPEIATDIVQTISTRLGSIVTPDIAETLTQVINTKVGDVVTPEIAKELTQVVNVEPGRVNLPEIPKEDETIRVNITATTADAMKEVRDMVGEIEGWQVEIEPKIEIKEEDLRTPFEKLKDSIKIDIAEENMQVDTTTLQTLMKTAIQNGIDGLDPNFSALQEKMREGIPDETWQALQDEINEKLKELGIEPIKIDFKTGNIAKDGENAADSWKAAAGAISSVGGALQSIEDPAGKIAGLVAQAIATVAQAYAQALSTDWSTKSNIWSFIGAAAASTASMITTISAIHSSTGYAQGGIVKGNSYSGDNIPAMVGGPSGDLVGLNAGEVVLTAAMTNNLANGIQNRGFGNMNIVGVLEGEKIKLVLNRHLKRTGQGELVTW